MGEIGDNSFTNKIDQEDNGSSYLSNKPEFAASGLKEAFGKMYNYLQENDCDVGKVKALKEL